MKHKLTLAYYAILIIVFAVACGDSNRQSNTTSGNFTADVSGSVSGQVSGPGIIRYIEESEVSYGIRPAYFFIADDGGLRDLGIVLVIPANTKPGTYQLESAGPFDIGTVFEVRVDQHIENKTESYNKNTAGTLTLEEFPNDGSSLAGTHVKGHFEFSTQGKNGEQLSAKGVFDFQGR